MASRGNFFGPGAGVQDVVSGDAARRQAEAFGPAQALDAMLKLRLSEQQAAQDLFKILSQTNPELIGTIIKDKPEALKALIQTPSTIRKPGTADPSDQIVDAFTFAYKNMPVQSFSPDMTPAQIGEIMQDSLNDLTPEALKDPDAIKSYFVFRAGRDLGVRAEAGAMLQSAGFMKGDEIRGIAGEADALGIWLTKNGRPTSPTDAFDILNSEPLRDQLLKLQISLAMQSKERGDQIDPFLISALQRSISTDLKRISSNTQRIAELTAFAESTLPQDLDPEAAAIFGGGADMLEAIKALEQENITLEKNIRVIEKIIAVGGKTTTVPSGHATTADELMQEIIEGR